MFDVTTDLDGVAVKRCLLEQAAERLKDGYAAYFQKYDVLLTPVIPAPSFKHGQAQLLIDGQTVNVMGIMSATTPLSVTGLPGVSMRFGISHERITVVVLWILGANFEKNG